MATDASCLGGPRSQAHLFLGFLYTCERVWTAYIALAVGCKQEALFSGAEGGGYLGLDAFLHFVEVSVVRLGFGLEWYDPTERPTGDGGYRARYVRLDLVV